MLYTVGYAPHDRGADAIALASSLAMTQDAALDIVHVLSGPDPADTGFPERGAQELRAGAAAEWLAEAAAQVPRGVTVATHTVFDDSFTQGLIEHARTTRAGLIVVGAARHGILGRFTVGSVANSLLHSSPLPVALAPSGYRTPRGITRMTAAVGTREGADTLLYVAAESASRRNVPLRLVSLVALDLDDRSSEDNAARAARAHADAVLGDVLARVDARTPVTATVAEGRTIADAITSVPWEEGEIMLVGSSRLAAQNTTFLGSTANKILRTLPVPLVVVPRFIDRAAAETAQL